MPSGGSWLRIALGLVGVGLAFASWKGGLNGVAWWTQVLAMVVAVIWVTLGPGSVGVFAVLTGVVLVRLFEHHADLDTGLIALIVLMPLAHQLASIAAAVPPRSTVRPRALVPTALRYLVAEAAVLAAVALSVAFGWLTLS